VPWLIANLVVGTNSSPSNRHGSWQTSAFQSFTTDERVNLLLSPALIRPDTRPPVPTSAASPCVSTPSPSCPWHSALLPVSLRPWCRPGMLCMRRPRPCCRRGMAARMRRRRLSSVIQLRVSTIRCPASLLALITMSASFRIHSTDLAWSHRARPP
jgi:hypothetical protein